MHEDASITTAKIADANVTQAKVATGVAGTGPAFSAYRSTNQSVTTATWTKVQLDTEEFDTASAFDNATNYRFTPLVAGYYQVNGGLGATGATSSLQAISVSIYKNGSIFKQGTDTRYGSTVGTSDAAVSALIYLNGSTDYVELWGYVTASSSPSITGTQHQTFMSASLVRAG